MLCGSKPDCVEKVPTTEMELFATGQDGASGLTFAEPRGGVGRIGGINGAIRHIAWNTGDADPQCRGGAPGLSADENLGLGTENGG